MLLLGAGARGRAGRAGDQASRQLVARHVAGARIQAHVPRSAHTLAAGARETIRFLPPLNVSEGEVDEALRIFEDSCAEVFG